MSDIADWMAHAGTTVVCELPSELGAITKMRVEGDRLICETESGIPFIVRPAPASAFAWPDPPKENR